ncbi:MAG TPA: hypothetical protein VK809_11705, partial [Bacteroidia bacterium]|nr:hypothetical protein [Bacteroidia bacterium]
MIRLETRQQVKIIVDQHDEGITLTRLHNQFQRMVTRLQLRTLLGALYEKGDISRERVLELNRSETKYYPFNGQPPVKRKRKPKQEEDKQILDVKDFLPGGKYQPYIEA